MMRRIALSLSFAGLLLVGLIHSACQNVADDVADGIGTSPSDPVLEKGGVIITAPEGGVIQMKGGIIVTKPTEGGIIISKPTDSGVIVMGGIIVMKPAQDAGPSAAPLHTEGGVIITKP